MQAVLHHLTTINDHYPHDPVLVYMGVGTANNATQQWPPFIDKLYGTYPNLHVVVLLMDPVHESPPLAAQQLRLRFDANEKWSKDRLHMFMQRLAIYTDADLYPWVAHDTNITPALHAMVDTCIAFQYTFLYHDYTGRFNGDLARYMDPFIKGHLDHIIFGWGQRDRDSCTINLSAPHILHMPVMLDWTTLRPILRWFNVYHFVAHPESLADYWSNTKEVDMQRQLMHFDAVCLEHLLETVLPPLRLLRREPKKLLDCHIAQISGHDPEPLRLLQNQQFEELTVVLHVKIAQQYDAIVRYRDWAQDGKDFVQRMTQAENPYVWANAVRNMLGLH